jgi:dipeptidyl aminopeptidase/acylaminoacyl peptidase
MPRFLLAFFLLSSFASAQTNPAYSPKRPMTFEDMMAMKRLGDTAVSPDGKWLAYSITTVNLDANTKTPELWLQAIAGGEPLKVAVAQPNDAGIQFSSDGKRIFFISGREGGQQIWLADFDSATGATSNAKKLTSLSTEADNAKWSPDGRFIVFTSAVYADCPAITPTDNSGDKCNADRDARVASTKVKGQIFTHLLYRHWNHFTSDKRTHLFLVDVASGAVRDLTPNDPRDVPPEYPTEPLGCGCAISPDSKELAFTENLDPQPAISTNADIFTLDLTNPTAKPVKVSTSPGGDFSPAYSPDGKYLAWRSQARAGYEADKFRVVLYDREKKTIKDLLPDFQEWVQEFEWGYDSRSLFFSGSEAGEAPVYRANLSGGFVTIASHGEFSGLHATPDQKSLIAVRIAVDRPSEARLIRLTETAFPGNRDAQLGFSPSRKYLQNERAVEPLTHLNDSLLAQLDLPKMESFWFTATDGVKVQGFLIRPPNFDAAKKYPLKFLIHGGPQGAWGDMWSYRWNAELFAANGYVVVMINPRGSTGYGQAFVDGVNNDWGGKPFTDLMTGLD